MLSSSASSSSSAAETNTDTILYVLLVTGDGVNCEAVNTCSGIHFPSVSHFPLSVSRR